MAGINISKVIPDVYNAKVWFDAAFSFSVIAFLFDNSVLFLVDTLILLVFWAAMTVNWIVKNKGNLKNAIYNISRQGRFRSVRFFVAIIFLFFIFWGLDLPEDQHFTVAIVFFGLSQLALVLSLFSTFRNIPENYDNL